MEIIERKQSKQKKVYKVTVTHFLRKERESSKKSSSDEDLGHDPSYPVYVRVIFLQQSFKIRSRLGIHLSEKTMNNLDRYPYFTEFFKIEEAAIRFSIQKYQPDSIKNFKISDWAFYYNEFNESICTAANRVLQNLFVQYLYDRNYSYDSYLPLLESMTNDFKKIDIFAKVGCPPAIDLVNDYKALFENSAYLEIQNFGFYFSYWDFLTGEYNKYLSKKYNTAPILLINTLKELLSDYLENREYYL